MSEELWPADIFLTRGSGFLSRAIRFFSRTIGEKRTKANHVGIVVKGGPIGETLVVEALSRVKRHRLSSRYGGKKGTAVVIYRPLNLTPEEIDTVVAAAESYVGRKYGVIKLGAHLLDWLLQGAYVFRRVTNDDRYPICSWVVAHAFAAVGEDFGVPAGAAQPDDIHDFCQENSDKYELVRAFAPL